MVATKVNLIVGFATINARMEKATDTDESGFRTVCLGEGEPHEPVRVKSHVDCPKCGRSESSTFKYADRALEVGDKLAVVTKEQIAEASGAPIKSMTLEWTGRDKVLAATLAGDSVQYLTPDKGGEEGYAVLVEVLRARPSIVAHTQYAPRTRNALWIVEQIEGRLVASKRCYPEEVRAMPALAPVEVRPGGVEFLGSYVDSMVEDFDLSKCVDTRRAGVKSLVDSTSVVGTALEAGVSNGDLLAALQANLKSVEGKAAPVKSTPRKRAPRKATAAPRKRAASKPTTEAVA